MGQSRTVRGCPSAAAGRCWPARQAKPSTTPPSSSSSRTPSRRRRLWRRRRGGRGHGSSPASLSLPPSMKPGAGSPLPPPGRGGRGRKGARKSSLRLLFLVVAVPVPFSDKFQQFFEFFVVPVLRNDREMVRQCRKPCWCRSCSLSKVVGFPSCRRGKSQ